MSNVVDLAKWRKLKSAVEIVRLDDGGERTPPREFMIFPLGKTITTLKGTFVLTDEGAAEVMQRYVEHGTDLHLDYEHLSIEPEKNANPELAVAAGWFDLELRNDGLWAVNVRWTPRAEKMLRNGEYRYISPAFHADEEGYIHELLNVALTNLPATDNLNALVAASLGKSIELSVVPFKEYPLVDIPWDAADARRKIAKWASSDGSGDKDKIDWKKYAQGFAWYDASDPENFGSYKLPHHTVKDGKLVTVKKGVEAAAAVLQGSRGGADIDNIADVKKHLASHYHQWGGTAPWEAEKNRRSPKETKMKAHPLAKHLKAKMKADGSDHSKMAYACGMSEERMKHLTAGHPPTTEEMTACMKHLALDEGAAKKLEEQHGEFLKAMDERLGFGGGDGDGDADGDGEGDDDEDEDDEKKPEKNTMDSQPSDMRKVPHEGKSAGGESEIDKGGKDEEDEDGGDNAPAKSKKVSRTSDGGLSRDELIALTGSTDPKEQRRKLAAMRDNASQTNSDREFLKQMRQESLAREKGELIALAKAQGRWTPNWEKFFEHKSNELLREMLTSGAMPVVGGEELQPLMPSGVEGVTLLRSDNRYISMCRVLGVSDDPKEYAKVKADIISLRDNTFDQNGYPTGRRGAQLGPKMTKALMDSWMGFKPGKPNSGDKRFDTRQELRRTAKADVVGQV